MNRVIKSQQIFPSDEAAFKLVYLAMRNISKKWTMPTRDWKPALNRFAGSPKKERMKENI